VSTGAARGPDGDVPVVSVPMARWAVAGTPTRIRTLLGSCVGVVLHDRQSKVGGVAHVVLPDSRGSLDQPGKYADTAVPALLAELRRLNPLARPVAKLVGGASMFGGGPGAAPAGLAIGQSNVEAVEAALARLGVTVVARDLGGESGRRVTLDIATGVVSVRLPAGEQYDI
jgi:chemotaxis protein CheD